MEDTIDARMFDHVIGKGLGPRRMDYTWRDVALYALAVGAGREDLPYIYERPGMKALPTFGLLPYLNSILMQPQRIVPYAPNEIVGDYIIEKLGRTPNRLHMAMDLAMHGMITPMQGTFLTEDTVEKVFDRGEGKGVVAQTKMDIYDLAGNPVCTARSTHYHGAFGGYGGEPFVSPKQAFPDRAPDYDVIQHLGENQAVLYRLLGDTYEVHIDPAVARGYGYEGPFMQGLCTFGFAARMGIQAVIPYEPERVTHLYAQMRSVCYPGQDVRFTGWKEGDGRVIFRLSGGDGKTLLDNGVMEYL